VAQNTSLAGRSSWYLTNSVKALRILAVSTSSTDNHPLASLISFLCPPQDFWWKSNWYLYISCPTSVTRVHLEKIAKPLRVHIHEMWNNDSKKLVIKSFLSVIIRRRWTESNATADNSQTRRTSMKSNFPVFWSRIPSIAVVMNWNRMSPEAPALNVGNCIVASSLRNVTMLVNKPDNEQNCFQHRIQYW